MANLFDIAERYKNVANLTELVASGEMEEEMLEQALQSMEGELTEKLANITYIMKNNEADVKLIDEEIKRLQARKKALNSTLNRLNQYMFDCLKLAKVKKISDSLNTWSIAKNPVSVEILDESLLSDKYLIREEVVKIDKKLLLAELKAGAEIEGANLKQGERLSVK